MALSSGSPWLERFPVKRRTALYVDFENSKEEFQRRLHLLNTPYDDAAIGYMNPDSKLDDKAFWEEELPQSGASFFVIDTLAAGCPGSDENMKSAADPLLYARRMVNKHGSSVLVLHHKAKNSESARGSTAIVGAVDHNIYFRGEYGHPQRLTDMKCRRGPGIKNLYVELTDETGLTVASMH